jgi:hypothetical protein
LCKECTRTTLRQSVEIMKSSEGSIECKKCARTLIQVLGERFPRGHTIRLGLRGESSESFHRECRECVREFLEFKTQGVKLCKKCTRPTSFSSVGRGSRGKEHKVCQ